MPILVEQSISGDGSVSFTPQHVNHVLCFVSVEGASVEHPLPTVVDRLERVGWFSFGARATPFDGTERIYWREIVWINWATFEWSPVPQVISDPVDVHIWASDIRWHLSPGVTVQIFVFGN